jgi:RNA polymerase sigma-70 factor (ECF subfamily)
MGRSRPAGPSDEERFRALYAASHADVLRFVTRRVPDFRAEDVVAEAFLVAWRRVAELPADDDDARAWVFGVARNVLLNDERGERRRRALAVRLAAMPPPTPEEDPELIARRVDLTRVWPRLTASDQEVLALAY